MCSLRFQGGTKNWLRVMSIVRKNIEQHPNLHGQRQVVMKN